MKFHRIVLRDYRGIRRLAFEPAESGVTIIQGDNEAGKSSIAEALWLIFEQHDDSASQAVRSIRPVDRDVASEIEVEVSTGPYRFTYFKRFHRGPRTELRLKAPRTEVLTGREADDRAKRILGETIDVALWKALRFQQGVSDDLEQLPAGKHQSLLAALDAATDFLGGEREKTLFERVQQEYDRYFTASGREKAAGDGANAPRLRRARDEMAAEVERLTERIITLEERALRATRLDVENAGVEQERQALALKREALVAADAARREKVAAVEALTSELRAAEADLRHAQAEHESRTAAAGQFAARQAELEEVRAQLAACESPLSALRTDAEGARAAVEASERRLEEARARAAAAEDAVNLAAAAFTAQTMAERLERLEKNEPEVSRLRDWLTACPLDARRLAAIRAAADKVTTLEARREAEGATVEIAATGGLEFEANGKPVRVEPGRIRRGPVSGELHLALPDGVSITIRAGAAARELDAQAADARAALDRLLDAAGAPSVEAAEEIVRERAANQATLEALQHQVKADLRDLASVEALRQKLVRERARIEGVANGAVPAIDDAKLERATASRAVEDADAGWRSARKTFDAATAAFADIERQVLLLSERAGSVEDELRRTGAALDEAREQTPDDSLAEAVRTRQAARDEAGEKQAAAQAELAALVDVRDDLAAADQGARVAESRWLALTNERAEIRGVLEDAGADGLHGKLTDAEQHLSAAEEELDAYLRRANAARTLFETLKRHRDTARENYAGPLRQKIETLGKMAYGEDFAVELSDDLRVARRTQQGITLDVSQLSTGAREQLSVLTRLACASLVSENGGAPLVLDDIFGWADPKRLRVLGPILARASGETQVLLFTCTPARFESVAPARVISLPSGQCEDRPSPGMADGAAPRMPAVAPEQPAQRAPVPPVQPQAAFDLFAESEPAGRR